VHAILKIGRASVKRLGVRKIFAFGSFGKAQSLPEFIQGTGFRFSMEGGAKPHFSLLIKNRQSKIQNRKSKIHLITLSARASTSGGILTIFDFGFQDHRITRSALAKILGGMVNPICLAVFKLITSSNFVGCSTGRSAGFVPFRIRSTK